MPKGSFFKQRCVTNYWPTKSTIYANDTTNRRNKYACRIRPYQFYIDLLVFSVPISGDKTNLYRISVISFFYTSLKAPNFAGLSLRSFVLSCADIRATFGKTRLNTLQSSKKDFNSVIVVGVLKATYRFRSMLRTFQSVWPYHMPQIFDSTCEEPAFLVLQRDTGCHQDL